MFAIMVGNTSYFMYQQQEAVYTALFDEVSDAKALLEQLSLVLQGRTSTYELLLSCVQKYVDEDLKRLDAEPSELLSRDSRSLVTHYINSEMRLKVESGNGWTLLMSVHLYVF